MPYLENRRSEKVDVIKNYSFSKHLKNSKKITPEFEIMLSGLNLEEIISLKLELSIKQFLNGRIYGIPLFFKLHRIAKHCVLVMAISISPSRKCAATFLGVDVKRLIHLLRVYKIRDIFEKKKG